jgi:hypothetical protein
MEKFEYSDIHKFFVSLGVVLIAFSIVTPWLIYREPFDLLIEKTKLEGLTDTAKAIIITRQNYLERIINIVPYFVITLFISGIALIVYGLFKWNKKQYQFDKREILTNEKLEKEIEKMSSKAVVEKLERAYEEGGKNVETNIKETQEEQKLTKENYIQEYISTEELFIKTIGKYFRKEFSFSINERVASKYDCDLILRTNDNRFRHSFVVELKYYSRTPTKEQFINSITHLNNVVEYFSKHKKEENDYHYFTGLLFVFYSQGRMGESHIKHYITDIYLNEIDKNILGKVKIYFFDIAKINDLTENQLEMIFNE